MSNSIYYGLIDGVGPESNQTENLGAVTVNEEPKEIKTTIYSPMTIRFDGYGRALVEFCGNFVALLMVDELRYMSSDFIIFESEYVRPRELVFTFSDTSATKLIIGFTDPNNVHRGFIRLMGSY